MTLRTNLIAAVAAAGLACLPPFASAQSVSDATGALSWATPETKLATLAAIPLAPGETSPLPDREVEMPRAGEENAYGVKVSPDLEAAYDSYLAGDTSSALSALARAGKTSGPVAAWHVSALRAQVLIVAGRAADAEREIEHSAALEQDAFGRDIFARALEGEALVWIGDYDRAAAVLAPVAEELKDWRLPTSYMAPPSNIPELVYVTTAQLRTYTALAGQFLLRGRTEEALSWAQRAETLYADVHFVSGHSLYGLFVSVHADSYYGRAINLSFLGAAKAVAARAPAAGAQDLDRADAFYDAIGFAPGRLTTQALRAWAALEAGQFDAADREAARAVDMALAVGNADMIWRVQALRAEALLADGRAEEAERAFRSADAAVDAATGALSSDRAKRRFGVGKSNITYRLAQFDIARGDLELLFADLERGRARAFVDMLASVEIAAAKDDADARRVREIDAEIRNLRLMASTIGVRAPVRSEDLIAERARRLDALAARNPALAEALGVRVGTLSQVQAALRPGDILVYGVPAQGTDVIRLLMVDSRSAELVTTSTTPDDLNTRLNALRRAVHDGDASRQERLGLGIGQTLGMNGWPPAERYLVVPTGPMFSVPWGIVTADTPVVVLPNAGWVRRAGTTQSRPGTTVVVGDPAFGGLLPQLEGAAAEAERVAALYGTEALSGRAATSDAVRSATGSRAEVLHLATHGRFEPTFPLRSAIYLSDSAGKASPVTALDLFRDPLPARLVVLSACETGVGRASAGDDFLGLVRSFYLGGSTGVVNSLWPVDDRGTRVFMETFHRHLSEGTATAWLTARDATREAGYPAAVYGAFVLGGALD